METGSHTSETTPCCKVGKVLEQYDLEHLDRGLKQRWTRDDGQSASIRELTRELNRELLRTALTNAGVTPIDGEAENLRRIFSDDSVSDNRRVEAKRRLARDGVPVDKLLDDFVSHQTIHNHLRNCQGVSRSEESGAEDRIGTARSTIFGLQSRTETVTEQTLAQLVDNDLLTPDSFDVVVDIQALCEECGRSHGIEQLLSKGSCDCVQNDVDQE
jgi:hypothetical protein